MAITQPSQNTTARGIVPRGAEEMEATLHSIRLARDTVIARNLELSGKLSVAEDRVSELEYEREAADHARDAALQLVQDLSQQSDDLREQMRVLTGENALLQTAKREWEQAGSNVVAAAIAPAAETDPAELEKLRHELADAEAMNMLSQSQNAKHAATMSSQLAAAQRARDIAVQAVANAQRQVERLAAERRALRAQIDADKATFEARLAQFESPLQTRSASFTDDTISEIASADSSNFEIVATAIDASGAIRAKVEALARDPAERAILDELDELFHEYAANAGGIGRAAIARFSSASGELTRWLCKTPRKIEATIPALLDAAALLADMSVARHPDRIADPAGALVYSVDDDGDNCECISMSLEKIALRTRYSMNPETALVEIGDLPCDIVILDVDLPGMDGFELARRIRATERHCATPIIFLSGLMSTKERLDSVSGGQLAFVAKPYNLNELGVIVLGMILKSRLAKSGDETISQVV